MKTYINQKYEDLSDFIHAIPDLFPRFGNLIYDKRNTIKVFKVNGLLVNVKRFKTPIVFNRLIYKYIRKSKAERSFRYAQYILRKGIDTPQPIAYIENFKMGGLSESYYISVHETVDGTMKEVYRQSREESEDLVKAFTQFTADLHKKKILHKDYSPGNIMYKKEGSEYRFYLVDLNRIKFKRLNFFESCKSFCRFKVDEDILNNISKEYSKIRKLNEDYCRRLILFCNQNFWKRQLGRHPEYLNG